MQTEIIESDDDYVDMIVTEVPIGDWTLEIVSAPPLLLVGWVAPNGEWFPIEGAEA